MPRSAGALISVGHVAQLERADLERVEAAQLQSAQADFADARRSACR